MKKRYILPNTTDEVAWSCNVTAIEHEREKCESSAFWDYMTSRTEIERMSFDKIIDLIDGVYSSS